MTTKTFSNEFLFALSVSADAIKKMDGGDMETETGWKSDELLAAWLTITAAVGDRDHAPTPAAGA